MTTAIAGLLHTFGEDGVGKTSLAITASNEPKKCVFLDGDSGKSREMIEELDWLRYHDLLVETVDKNEVAYFAHVMSTVKNLPNGLDVLVLDNAKQVFNAAHSYLLANKTKYRATMRGSGEIIGGLEWQEVREHLLPELYALMRSKARLVVIITHEREQNIGGVKTGLMTAAADPSLRKAASPIIRLTRSRDGHPAPVGLVIKNIGKFVDGEVIRVLPPRIPHCTWKTIKAYLADPVGNRELTDDETPNEFEISLITGSLTAEQKRQYEFNKKMALLGNDEQLTNAIRGLIADGVVAPPAIIRKLAEMDIDATIDQIQAIIRVLNEV
jgi:hypothetical protein